MTQFHPQFDYDMAFARNIGWLTQWEQQRLRAAKIAVAGAGGVGGIHLQTLTRLGFQTFHVADLDRFELANFNRQAGATMQTLDLPKADVAKKMVMDINPDADVTVFDKGVTEDNLDAFLGGVDVYIDGLDFFVLELRAKLFRRARELGITAITAAPIGMGTGYLVFTPESMSFDEFFDLGPQPDSLDGAAGFLLGLTPAMLQRGYLADPAEVDMLGQRGPSTAIACQLCAGVAAAEALKVILKRGPSKPTPYYHHFDAYRGQFVSRKLHGGAKHPLQRLKRSLLKSLTGTFSRKARPPQQLEQPSSNVLDRVLEAARWAPSADNTQPWTFTKTGPLEFTVAVTFDADHIYEYRRGEPTRLASGMLLENMRLRAARFGYRLDWSTDGSGPGKVMLNCVLEKDADCQRSPLEQMIEIRSTYRHCLSPKRLKQDVKDRLEAAVGSGYIVHWHSGLKDRFAHAALNARAAVVRLRTAETIPVHQDVVRFHSPFPDWGLPSRGIGLSPWAHALMQFAFASRARSLWLLSRLGGAYYAALEMDILPGVFCGAHFSLEVKSDDTNAQDLSQLYADLRHGAAIERLWLACAAEGLAFQPACAPICFYDYGSNETPFSQSPKRRKAAARFAQVFSDAYDHAQERIVFRGRVGAAPRKGGQARSLRLPLSKLMRTPEQKQTKDNDRLSVDDPTEGDRQTSVQ